MKKATVILAVLTAAAFVSGCAGGPAVKTSELDNKGNAIGVSAPDWIKLYVANGVTAVQAQPQFKDKYCIIGEESSTSRQFALAWADNFSAQQRIGAMLRTTIASKFQATEAGASLSSGGANSTSAAGDSSAEYRQEIDNAINAVVNISYSGAQRDSDWWVLMRRYDPDQKDAYSDEYTAYVLYTIPKAELNRQIASALETSVSKDSALYDITIALARDIMINGVEYLDPKAGAETTAAPSSSNGGYTYSYSPRLREAQGGVDKNGYLDRIVVRSGYFTVYLVDRPAGNGNWPENSWGRTYYGDISKVVLQNLDNPQLIWTPAVVDRDEVSGGCYLTFQGVRGSRFSLSDNNYNPPYIFEEIIIG
ncbi:MAG: hypothetical protein LBF74_05805 [Treponema sp.]|jgi:hypothetical protein|nr:hypothetical protein [Treponema sp.]